MTYKASFLNVPCWFDDSNNQLEPRYGWWNGILLDLVIWLWLEFGWLIAILFSVEEEGFPIILYEEKNEK